MCSDLLVLLLAVPLTFSSSHLLSVPCPYLKETGLVETIPSSFSSPQIRELIFCDSVPFIAKDCAPAEPQVTQILASKCLLVPIQRVWQRPDHPGEVTTTSATVAQVILSTLWDSEALGRTSVIERSSLPG